MADETTFSPSLFLNHSYKIAKYDNAEIFLEFII